MTNTNKKVKVIKSRRDDFNRVTHLDGSRVVEQISGEYFLTADGRAFLFNEQRGWVLVDQAGYAFRWYRAYHDARHLARGSDFSAVMAAADAAVGKVR